MKKIQNWNVRYFKQMKNKKAQMKIQEMAFVLIALFLLFSMAFIFYVKLKSSSLERTSYELKQSKALSILDKVVAMPELSCSKSLGKESLCIDEDKLKAMNTIELNGYKELWRGIKEIKIKKIYPADEEFIVHSSEIKDYESYSSFTRICKQRYENTAFYQCSIGIVLISI